MLASATINRINMGSVDIIMTRDAVTITPKTNMFTVKAVGMTMDTHISIMRVVDMIMHRIKSDN